MTDYMRNISAAMASAVRSAVLNCFTHPMDSTPGPLEIRKTLWVWLSEENHAHEQKWCPYRAGRSRFEMLMVEMAVHNPAADLAHHD